MNPIANYEHYNTLMKRGLLDKTFFLKKLDSHYYMDYGCADGSMIEFMAKLFPEYHFFGYDNDQKMIDIANSKNIPNAKFSTNFKELMDEMETLKQLNPKIKTTIILSSLIHEIYAYLDLFGIEEFWYNVFNNDFDYIAIRDMLIEVHEDYMDIDNAIKIRKNATPFLLKQFEKKYGSIDYLRNQIHFLLKYRYTDNWARELNENYLGFNLNIMKRDYLDQYKKMFGVEYKQKYLKKFNIPFQVERIKEDFDIELNQNTHVKMILEKVK